VQFIYGLTDPLYLGPAIEAVRYIGRTDNPTRRYKQHCMADDYSDKSTWIKGLKAKNLLPGLVIIEAIDPHDRADLRERHWIEFYLNKGTKLFNVSMSYEPVVCPLPVSFVDKEQLGIRLRKAYVCKVEKEISFNYSELARQAEAGQAHIKRIIHGKTLPSRDLLIRICKILGCSYQETVEIFNQTDHRVPSDEELDEVSVAA